MLVCSYNILFPLWWIILIYARAIGFYTFCPLPRKYNFTDALTFWNYQVFDITPHGWFSLNFRYAWRALLYTELLQFTCVSFVSRWFSTKNFYITSAHWEQIVALVSVIKLWIWLEFSILYSCLTRVDHRAHTALSDITKIIIY